VEQNRKAGQNPPRVVAPTEEEEENKKRLVTARYLALKSLYLNIHLSS